MRRVTIGLVLMLAAALPAHAQNQRSSGTPANQTPEMPAEEREKLQALDKIERNYNETMRRTRSQDAPAKTDPWANMRGNEAPAAKR